MKEKDSYWETEIEKDIDNESPEEEEANQRGRNGEMDGRWNEYPMTHRLRLGLLSS